MKVHVKQTKWQESDRNQNMKEWLIVDNNITLLTKYKRYNRDIPGEEKKAPPTSNGIDVPSTSGATVTVKEGAEIKLDNVEPLKTKQTNAAAAK